MRTSLAGLLTLALVAMPPAAAYSASIDISSSGAVVWAEDWELMGPHPVLRLEGPPTSAPAKLEVSGILALATYERVIARAEDHGAVFPASGATWENVSLSETSLELYPGAVGLRLTAVGGPATSYAILAPPAEGVPRWLPTDAGRVNPLAGAPPGPFAAPSLTYSWKAGWHFAGDHFGNVGFPAQAKEVALSGPLELEADSGAVLVAWPDGRRETIELGVVRTDVAAPAGVARRETMRVAFVHATHAEGIVPLEGMWGLASPLAAWQPAGSFGWPRASGSYAKDGQTFTFSDEPFWATGTARLFLSPGEPTSYEVAGTGEWTRIAAGSTLIVAGPATSGASGVVVLATVGLAAAVALAAGIALYSRIVRSRVRDHPRRDAMMGFIEAEPGIHARELQRRSGLAWGAFAFHLQMLTHAGHVRTRVDGRTLALYPASAVSMPPRLVGAAKAVFDGLAPGTLMGPAEVARVAGVSRQLARHHLEALAAKGIVRKVAGADGAAYGKV